VCAAATVAWREKDLRFLLVMPMAFGLLHFGYGLGSLLGLGIVVKLVILGTLDRRKMQWSRNLPRNVALKDGNKVCNDLVPGYKATAFTGSNQGYQNRLDEENLPFVSVVIPCRNEEGFIGDCLDSIIANSYSKDHLEVIVVDGLSEDKTRQILNDYIARYPFIRMLDNNKKEQQFALNMGITYAKGDIILRADAHSTYKYDYISECIRALCAYPADNVGGRWVTVPRSNSLVARAICFATSTRFGVGNAYYRMTRLFSNAPVVTGPRWDINVAYFCCRKEIFDKIGLFNESLDRSEDIDFRSRLRKKGYRTLFIPTVECYYSIRTKFPNFVTHMFRNGLWVFLPLNKTPVISFSLRHIVPLLFVVGLVGTGVLSAGSKRFAWLLLGIVGIYSLGSLYSAIGIAVRERDLRLVAPLFMIFPVFHLTYGLGSLVGLMGVISTQAARIGRGIYDRVIVWNTG